MEDMASICDSILVLNKGSVYNYGTTKEIFSDVEALNKIGLNVPLISTVFKTLNEKYGFNFENIITVDDAINTLLPILKKEVKAYD